MYPTQGGGVKRIRGFFIPGVALNPLHPSSDGPAVTVLLQSTIEGLRIQCPPLLRSWNPTCYYNRQSRHRYRGFENGESQMTAQKKIIIFCRTFPVSLFRMIYFSANRRLFPISTTPLPQTANSMPFTTWICRYCMHPKLLQLPNNYFKTFCTIQAEHYFRSNNVLMNAIYLLQATVWSMGS